MRRAASRLGWLFIIVTVAGCSGVSGTTTPGPSIGEPSSSPPTSPGASTSEPAARTILVDTDVAGDDLVALAFLVSAPHVTIAAITVSGTGEAHCEGGVDVVLRLLEALDAPDIPVACGRETPLAGTHAFPDAWREGADHGSGLDLPQTDRQGSSSTAIQLIEDLSTQHQQLLVLTLGPLTNLADALTSDADLAKRLGPVFVMGGALHVPGNLLGPGAPEGNSVAEWNVYVDPHAAQVVVDAGLEPSFVSLDGTSQVPVTRDFARRAMESGETAAARVLAELFAANPFMTDGSYFLWDALAAELAAGYPVGSFSAAGVVVEEAEGPESGFTRPSSPTTNIKYLSEADSAAATDTLLRVLNGD